MCAHALARFSPAALRTEPTATSRDALLLHLDTVERVLAMIPDHHGADAAWLLDGGDDRPRGAGAASAATGSAVSAEDLQSLLDLCVFALLLSRQGGAVMADPRVAASQTASQHTARLLFCAAVAVRDTHGPPATANMSTSLFVACALACGLGRADASAWADDGRSALKRWAGVASALTTAPKGMDAALVEEEWPDVAALGSTDLAGLGDLAVPSLALLQHAGVHGSGKGVEQFGLRAWASGAPAGDALASLAGASPWGVEALLSLGQAGPAAGAGEVAVCGLAGPGESAVGSAARNIDSRLAAARAPTVSAPPALGSAGSVAGEMSTTEITADGLSRAGTSVGGDPDDGGDDDEDADGDDEDCDGYDHGDAGCCDDGRPDPANTESKSGSAGLSPTSCQGAAAAAVAAGARSTVSEPCAGGSEAGRPGGLSLRWGSGSIFPTSGLSARRLVDVQLGLRRAVAGKSAIVSEAELARPAIMDLAMRSAARHVAAGLLHGAQRYGEAFWSAVDAMETALPALAVCPRRIRSRAHQAEADEIAAAETRVGVSSATVARAAFGATADAMWRGLLGSVASADTCEARGASLAFVATPLALWGASPCVARALTACNVAAVRSAGASSGPARLGATLLMSPQAVLDTFRREAFDDTATSLRSAAASRTGGRASEVELVIEALDEGVLLGNRFAVARFGAGSLVQAVAFLASAGRADAARALAGLLDACSKELNGQPPIRAVHWLADGGSLSPGSLCALDLCPDVPLSARAVAEALAAAVHTCQHAQSVSGVASVLRSLLAGKLAAKELQHCVARTCAGQFGAPARSEALARCLWCDDVLSDEAAQFLTSVHARAALLSQAGLIGYRAALGIAGTDATEASRLLEAVVDCAIGFHLQTMRGSGRVHALQRLSELATVSGPDDEAFGSTQRIITFATLGSKLVPAADVLGPQDEEGVARCSLDAQLLCPNGPAPKLSAVPTVAIGIPVNDASKPAQQGPGEAISAWATIQGLCASLCCATPMPRVEQPGSGAAPGWRVVPAGEGAAVLPVLRAAVRSRARDGVSCQGEQARVVKHPNVAARSPVGQADGPGLWRAIGEFGRLPTGCRPNVHLGFGESLGVPIHMAVTKEGLSALAFKAFVAAPRATRSKAKRLWPEQCAMFPLLRRSGAVGFRAPMPLETHHQVAACRDAVHAAGRLLAACVAREATLELGLSRGFCAFLVRGAAQWLTPAAADASAVAPVASSGAGGGGSSEAGEFSAVIPLSGVSEEEAAFVGGAEAALAFLHEVDPELARHLHLLATCEEESPAGRSLLDGSLTFSFTQQQRQRAGAAERQAPRKAKRKARPAKGLVPGGLGLAVSASNRVRYVRLTCARVLTGDASGDAPAYASVLETLHAPSGSRPAALEARQTRPAWSIASVLREALLGDLPELVHASPRALYARLSSPPAVDVAAIEASTSFATTSRVAKWFWDVARSLSADQLRHLLVFWTGEPGLPIGDVAGEPGRPPLKLEVALPEPVKAGANADDARAVAVLRLPTAMICDKTLLLPVYESKADLSRAVLALLSFTSVCDFGLH
ncbi:hypothetical protein FNF29_05378 [Cafeteria roenbergensis]|uniref:HECT-type E3 ubiquitin transferase n=1 Tax=Cafeteria roenbergensis TaxID=33653 RepID=A0A5A8CB93_CAFRO|nr:hypothetical protein FNF29_05378 [Cafeteria roenbergensis]|eukprot:KAA0150366.1 hypothetical protein FNF29_05378 [Cafeteria roenbergensis]